GLLAPWVLHTGLGPDAAASGFMTQVIAVAIQEGGMPIPRGGGDRLVEALVRLIRDHGGVCEADRDVDRIVGRDGEATGVRLAGGERGRAWASSGRGNDRRRPAADDRRLARSRRRGPALDPAPGAPLADQGRRGRRDRRRRRQLDGGAARALRRADPGTDRR